jgi:hypothetical protein
LPELYDQLIHANDEELDDIYWKIYLNKIEQVDANVADVLGELYEHHFDLSCLNNDEGKRNAFLSKLASLRYSELERS